MYKIILEVPKNIDAGKIENHLIKQLKKETARLLQDSKHIQYLSKLHVKVSKETGLRLRSTEDLIEQLQAMLKAEKKTKSTARQKSSKTAGKPSKTGKKGTRKPRTAITQEFIASVKKLAGEGLNKSQIARKLNCSLPTVNKALAAQ